MQAVYAVIYILLIVLTLVYLSLPTEPKRKKSDVEKMIEYLKAEPGIPVDCLRKQRPD